MQRRRVTIDQSALAALFGLSLAWASVAACRAEGGGAQTDADEEALRAEAKKVFKEKVGPFVETYCVKCHGPRPKAGINLQSALKHPGSASAFQHWKKSVANVKVHDMPPEDARSIPSEEERRDFVEWIGMLKYLSPEDPGPFVIRRLSRTEYGNTLHDLYGVDPSIAESLPEEVVGEGYLNSISPLQSELFLEIANQLVDQVLEAKDGPHAAVRKRLFGDVPAEGADLREEARRIARPLARDAYRRPPTEAEIDVLVDVFDLARENGLDFTASLGLMWKAVLVSPQFLFITPGGGTPAEVPIVPLDDHQLASRLSYLLWSAPPDAELSALADEGTLHRTEVLRAQAERLLMHPRARALFDGFGAQWLRVGGLDRQVFDPKLFPEMTPELRGAMMDEVRLFFESIVRENESVVRFVDGGYSFLNEALAGHYGLKLAVTGPELRRVELDDPNRGGVLAMAATLASTSFPGRTSPVRRGVWVLEQVLGERVPPAPPGVPELEEIESEATEGLTLRQLTELHQSEATCANCHRVLDPIGFGLENFDAVGRWRDQDEAGAGIDSAGQLPGGESFSSPAELKALLAARETDLARNLTERLMAHALGRKLEGYDEIVVDRLMARIAEDGYRVRTIVTEVIASYLFTHRRVEG